MGIGDDIKHGAQEFGGKAKEATGDLTGNQELKREGQAEQTEAKAKKAVSDAADGVKHGVDDVKRKLT